jgi:hypothetical protein
MWAPLTFSTVGWTEYRLTLGIWRSNECKRWLCMDKMTCAFGICARVSLSVAVAFDRAVGFPKNYPVNSASTSHVLTVERLIPGKRSPRPRRPRPGACLKCCTGPLFGTGQYYHILLESRSKVCGRCTWAPVASHVRLNPLCCAQTASSNVFSTDTFEIELAQVRANECKHIFLTRR